MKVQSDLVEVDVVDENEYNCFPQTRVSLEAKNLESHVGQTLDNISQDGYSKNVLW
jgi:hypothetical protein